METVVFGSFKDEGLEVVERGGRLFVRYDAGAHVPAFREDEISQRELTQIASGEHGTYRTIIELQARLTKGGEDPHQQNWRPGPEQGWK